MNNQWILAGTLSLLVALSGVAHASDYEREWEDDDHAYDRARRAVERGEILPMAQLLKRLKTQAPGEVVGVELEQEHGTWVYEFKIIDAKGRLIEVYLDAQTGTVISME
jgi:uncharacterized membrane protein YkoI